jgi:hypothetical protein
VVYWSDLSTLLSSISVVIDRSRVGLGDGLPHFFLCSEGEQSTILATVSL